MNTKNLIRKSLQKFYQWGTFGKASVCLWCLNNTTMSLIPGIIKNKYKVVFLPEYKDRHFDSDYFNGDFKLPVKMFPPMLDVLSKFFPKYNVAYYVFDKLPMSDMFSHAVLSMAKGLKERIKIVYIDHGDSAQENYLNDYMFLNIVDYYYARDLEMKNHLIDMANEQSIDVKVRTWEPPPLKWNRKEQQNLLLYVPAFHCRETFGTCYSDTLKYKRRLDMVYVLESLAYEYDLQVVWKYMIGEEGYDPVPDLIKNLNVQRIAYENRNNFDYWLSRASMFVSDCASTTLYSAVKAGVKSLVLWDSRLPKIRKGAGEMFGESIFTYDDMGRAIERLETFVSRHVKNQFWNIPSVPTKQDRYPWELR